MGHDFDACKCLNVNYSAPRVDMVTFKCKYSFFFLVKIKKEEDSFINVHDGQTVLAHGTSSIHVMATDKNKKRQT